MLSRSSSRSSTRSSSRNSSRTSKKRKLDKVAVAPNEKELLQKLMGQVYYILREPNYLIAVTKSQLGKENIKAWYTFNMLDPEMSTPTEPYIVSSVSISVKTAPILIPPITRSIRPQMLETFHIELVDTPHEAYRRNGYATLLLIYGICYLKILLTDIKIFTLNDESDRNAHIAGNIYHNLGFVYMDGRSIDLSRRNKTKPINTTKPIDTTKILNFNIEPIEDWVNVRCLGLINQIREKWGMHHIDPMDGGRKQAIKQAIKRSRKQSKSRPSLTR